MTITTWYPRYVGDYGRKTAHLTLMEHGAYTLLLDWYYANATPLPADERQLQRICSAFSPKELEAVRSVLKGFFTLTADGWRNHRADLELSKRLEISDKRRAAQAEKERRRLERKGASAGANAPSSAGANAGASADTTTSTTTISTPSGVERDIASGTLPGIPPAVPRPDPIPEAFEAWWKGWTPHGGCPKGHKQDALKAYRKAISQGADPDVLTRQRDAYLAECRRVDQFTRHASTWLNGRGWLESYDAGAGPGPAANRDAGARNRSGERQGPASIVLAAQRVADAMQRGLDHDTGGRSGPLDGGDVVQ